MCTRWIVLALTLMVPVTAAVAQTQTATVASGTVTAVTPTTLSLKNDTGGAVDTFPLAPTLVVVQARPGTIEDIHANDFIASAAVRQADGKLHSTELRIFPDVMRGVGEGQRPMHDARNQTMTNATVTGTANLEGHNTIRVQFPGGNAELILDPGVPITKLVPVDRTALHPGAAVRAQVVPTPDGKQITRIILQ